MVISHIDSPGAVAAVTSLLSNNSINIANMKVYRSYRGGDSMMVIETDQKVGKELEVLIGRLPKIRNATIIEPV